MIYSLRLSLECTLLMLEKTLIAAPLTMTSKNRAAKYEQKQEVLAKKQHVSLGNN
jgi:hypothetical protein